MGDQQHQPIDHLAYGISDAARVVGVSPSTIKRLLAAGQLASVRIGARRVIMRTELERLLAEAPLQPVPASQ
jgi:excisionase family DNA binding protein